ncbi:hypothetical protein POTOM_002292 [Populus tomentosa]|uniref:ERV/ALR sulfhydryl oxidase domain-containing protein n=1 Tax=Populus tomentosa TaxID=118781 RepID=A0A8X8DJM2_POPTO|nr:hypothetical protein POTOM_002292 [Populus tomentosa]
MEPNWMISSDGDCGIGLGRVNFREVGKSVAPVTKEELGKTTWAFPHTLAAQYPEHPAGQQKKDVKEPIFKKQQDCFAFRWQFYHRMYPCQECADHFKEVLRYADAVFCFVFFFNLHPSPDMVF